LVKTKPAVSATPSPQPSPHSSASTTPNGTSNNKDHHHSTQASGANSNSNSNANANVNSAAAQTRKRLKALSDLIQNFEISHNSSPIIPRGMVNRGNMCFMHVILQPLLFCAPLFNLLRQIDPTLIASLKTTPVLETMVHFIREFSLIDEANLRFWKDGPDSERCGSPLLPEYIYDALHKHRANVSAVGRQEDAEEYLGFLLDSLHEEMLTLKKQYGGGEQLNQKDRITDFGYKSQESDDNEWMEVGPKNKMIVTRDVQDEEKLSPITKIFGGKLRSVVQVQGKASVTLQPFHSLQLDIAPPEVKSIREALVNLTKTETLDGFLNQKTKIAVEATKRITIDKLPPILILHLKRFIYDNIGGVQKSHKYIEYPLTLDLKKDHKLTEHGEGRYQLFAVSYHHGNTATGGHYTCDVLHSSGDWLRLDDTIVTKINHSKVTDEKPDRVAYLLFYRQVDNNKKLN